MKKVGVAVVIVGVSALFLVLNNVEVHASTWLVASLAAKVWHLVLFGALWLATYFAGRGVVALIRWREDVPPEVATAAGIVVFATGAFALAAAGLAYPWVVRGVVLAVLAAGAVPWARRLRLAPARARAWLAAADPGILALGGFALLVAVPLLVTAAEPPLFWDACTYHLAVPRFYAEAHRLVYLPYNVYSSMPLGATMYYLWAMLWDGYTTANGCYMIVSGLAVALVYRLSRLWLSRFYAAVAAALVFFTPVFFIVMPGAHVDHFVIVFVAAALGVYFGRPEGWKSWRAALAFGVFLGAALGVKYTSVYVLGACAPVFVYDLARRRLRPSHLALALGVAFIVFLPWLVKACVERGNPVFPVFHDVWGGRDFARESYHRLVAWQQRMGAGRSWRDYLLLPYRISVASDYTYRTFCGIYLPYLLPLAALAFVFFRRAGRLLAFGGVYFICWALGPQQLRFMDAGLAVLAVAAAGTLAAVDGLWSSGIRTAWRGLLLATLAFTGFAYNAGAVVTNTDGFAYLGGLDREEFLMRYAGFYRAQKYINEATPPDAKVLMVFTNHTLYLRRPAIYDSFFEASPFLMAAEKSGDAGALAALARRWGVSYVHVYHYFEEKVWPEYGPRTKRIFYQFLDGYCAPVYHDPWNDVYVINPSSI